MIGSFTDIQKTPDAQLLTILTLTVISLKNHRGSVLPELASMFDMKDLSKLAHVFGG